MSPNTHFLQIMASGREITRTHHRASNRVMSRGEPVFLCFCGMTNFHRFKLGFDRTFWIGEIEDPKQAELYEVAVNSQKAALDALVDVTRRHVNGSISLFLCRGNLSVAGRSSSTGLYREEYATFESGGLYDHADATIEFCSGARNEHQRREPTDCSQRRHRNRAQA